MDSFDNFNRHAPSSGRSEHRPSLDVRTHQGITFHTDQSLFERRGIRVAFSERTGGVSRPPFDTLNLAGHVTDEPIDVDENRSRLLSAIGIAGARDSLTTAEQVHGVEVRAVDSQVAGAGAYVTRADPPVPGTDALVTVLPDVPLLMLYADCVPIIMVAEEPRRAVAVVHSGWRGTLGRIAQAALAELCQHSGCEPRDVLVYVGPHIGGCCYEVDEILISQFCNAFDTITAVDRQLDLGAALRETLVEAGVERGNVAETGVCTFDHTERFFSYRAHGRTGRHGALAMITKGER